MDLFKDKYTQVVSIDETEQCYLYNCYKNGKYTHTVKMHYYTEEQLNEFHRIYEKLKADGEI